MNYLTERKQYLVSLFIMTEFVGIMGFNFEKAAKKIVSSTRLFVSRKHLYRMRQNSSCNQISPGCFSI